MENRYRNRRPEARESTPKPLRGGWSGGPLKEVSHRWLWWFALGVTAGATSIFVISHS
jgi:hypothetical protein